MKKWMDCLGRWLLGCVVTLVLPFVAHAEEAIEKERGVLPRVLLVGDSISMGYDQPTRELLAGRATVHRPPENCQSTQHGLKRIETWLGDTPWDVIHFNWGIWDAHYLNGGRIRTSPKEYEKNLRTLVRDSKPLGRSWSGRARRPSGIFSRTASRSKGRTSPSAMPSPAK